MSNLSSKSYNKGKFYVSVTKEKPFTKYVDLRDFGASEFAEMAYEDLKELVDGTHRYFRPTQKGVYQLVYRLGMYGTIVIRFGNEQIAKEAAAKLETKLYFMCAMTFAIEELVFPVVDEKE